MFRCDGGKEFACEKFDLVLTDCGITLLLSAPYATGQKELWNVKTVRL